MNETDIWTPNTTLEVAMSPPSSPERAILHKVQKAVKALASARWQDMKAVYSASPVTGQQALIGGVLIKQWGSAGRLAIELKNPDTGEWVAILGDLTTEVGDGRCGLDNMHCSPTRAIEIIKTVQQNWDSSLFRASPNRQ